MDDPIPLDADELMLFAERIESLPPEEADWVGRLFQECLRARMHAAGVMATESGNSAEGREVGLAENTLAQVVLDTAEWLKTLWEVGYMGSGHFPSAPRSAFPLVELEDVLKSSLFARIREGKRPLPFPPPTRNGLPWHDLVDTGESCHRVEAEILPDEAGRPTQAVVAGCNEWVVIEEPGEDRGYLIQHRRIGPLFRLHLDAGDTRLCREPPQWSCRITTQERGGFRHFTLHWPLEDGQVQSIPLRATSWERAESDAAYWVATKHPERYGQVRFERAAP